jgi:amino acid transporter
MNGWVILVTDLLFMAFAGPQAGQALLQIFNNAAVYSIGPINMSAGDLTATTIAGCLVVGGITWMVYTGIKLAARFQYVLLALEYFIVVGLAITGFVKQGGTAFSWSWLSPFHFDSFSALAAGVVISVFLYWGWDTAANLNEESEDSTENPGRAGMLGMVALLVLFLVATISVQMVLTPDELTNSGTGTLTLWADKMVGQPWASVAVLALLSSTVATLQTTLLPSARTAFSMGRDGVLGRAWARVNPRFMTPSFATIAFGVMTVLIALVNIKLDKLNAIVSAGVAAIGLLVSYYYGMTGIACTVYFRKHLRRSVGNFLAMGVIPSLSALALFSLAGYLVYSDWTATDTLSFDGTNTRFQVIVPVAVLAAGIPALIWSRLRRHAQYYSLPRESAEVVPVGAPGA